MKEIKFRSKKWFRFFILVALLIILSVFVINFAFARNVVHSNEVEHQIEGTSLYLVGETEAQSPSDYEISVDSNGTDVIIKTSGWALIGKDFSVNIYLAAPDLELRDLAISGISVSNSNTNIVVKDGCNVALESINVPKDKLHNSGGQLKFTGTGNVDFAYIRSRMLDFDLIIDGPTFRYVAFAYASNPIEETISLCGNLDMISGKCIVDLMQGSGSFASAIYIFGNYNIHINNNFELFCNLENSIVIEPDNDSFKPSDNWTEGSLKASLEYHGYTDKDQITNIAVFEKIGNNWLAALEGKSPKSIYHPIIAPIIPKLESISVETLPTKTEYLIGEQFDKTGLTIAKTYDDASVESGYVPEDNEITGFDSTTEGEKTITITCSDPELKNNVVSTTFTVVVKSSVTPQPDPDDPIVPISNEVIDNQEVLLLPSSETGDDLVLVALLSAVLTISFLFTFRFKRNR